MRRIKERVDPTNAAVREGTPVGAAVTARPSGPSGAPTVFDPLMDVARSLESLNPELAKYAAHGIKEKQEDQRMLGAKARAEQADTAPIAMTREQDPSWQQGYMEMHGKMMGAQDTAQMREFYEKNKRNMTAEELDAFLVEQRKSRLEGFDDPDALKQYLPQLVAEEARTRDDFSRVQVERARQKEVEFATASINKHIIDLREMTTEGAAADRERIFREVNGRTGMTRPEFMGRYVQAVASDPQAMPADLQHLYVKGPGNIAPVDGNAPDGTPLKPLVDRAMVAAQHRSDEALKKKQAEYNAGIGNWVGNLLAKDTSLDPTDGPLAIADPEAFAFGMAYPGGPYDGPGQAAALAAKIRAAQDDQREAIRVASYMQAWGALPAALADTKAGKKLIQKTYEDNWVGANLADTEDFQRRLQNSMRLQEKLGQPDPFIKSLVENADQYGSISDPSGKETLSPELQAALAIYRGVGDSNNPNANLALFKDDGLAFMGLLDAALKTSPDQAQALALAKRAMQNKEAIKHMWLPGERTNTMRSEGEAYEGWMRNRGNGWFSTVNNKEYIGNLIVRSAEAIYASSKGAFTKEQAVELARKRIEATHAHDGVGTMFPIPQDVSRERAMQVFPALVKQAQDNFAAANNGQKLENYIIEMRQVNGKSVWAVTDPLGTLLTPPHNFAEVEHAWLKMEGRTTEQLVEKRIAGEELIKRTPAQQQVDQLTRDYAAGKLKPRDFQEKYEKARRAVKAEADAAAQAAYEKHKSIPKLPTVEDLGPPSREPVPQPVGPEMKTKDIALKHADTDPAFALTVAGEGFRNTVYKDTRGKRTIGLGYNIDARKEADVRKDFASVGIKDPERQTRILEGKEAITPDEGIRLHSLIKKDYVKRAMSLVGNDVWTALSPFRQAVLTDMAYQMGRDTFKAVWEQMRTGDIASATSTLSKAMGGADRGAKRRMQLRLAMWENPLKFKQLVEQGI